MTKNNSSSIITLAGLVLAIYALCNAEKITEGFGYGVAQGRVVVDRTVDCGSKRANTKGMGKVVPEYKWKQGDHDFSNIGYNEQLKRAFERQNQQQQSISRNSYYNEIADEEEGYNHFQNRYSNIKGSQAAKTGDVIQSQGTYQATLEPRFMDEQQIQATVKYNPAPMHMQAVNPSNPLTFRNMAQGNYNPGVHNEYTREGYDTCGSSMGEPYMTNAGSIPANNYSNGNYQEITNSLYSNPGNPVNVSEVEVTGLPIKDMTSLCGDDEDPTQAVVYDRFMIANLKSKLQSLGDYIRGDLPIVPCGGSDGNSGWFRPSAHPQVDLNRGAMAVMGGTYNDTSNELASLINTTTDATDSLVSGIDYGPTFTQVSDKRNAQRGKNGKMLTATTDISDLVFRNSPVGDINVSDYS